MKIRIAGTVADSIVDGPGLRYALFTQGCPHHCPGCHNPQTHDPNGGYEVDVDDILKEIASDPLLDGVTFSGGDPLMQPEPLAIIANEVHKLGLSVIVYTGYSWERIQSERRDDWNRLLTNVDVLVDGPFVQSLHDWKLKFRGSSNQRFVDVKRSLAEGKLVELDSLERLPK